VQRPSVVVMRLSRTGTPLRFWEAISSLLRERALTSRTNRETISNNVDRNHGEQAGALKKDGGELGVGTAFER
jgi:hypothetical protein